MEASARALFVPLGGAGEAGVLVATDWISVAQFAPESTEVMIAFAGEAALTLRLGEALRAQRQLAVYVDRDRIAPDLHDQVVQRLFVTGMALESITRDAQRLSCSRGCGGQSTTSTRRFGS